MTIKSYHLRQFHVSERHLDSPDQTIYQPQISFVRLRIDIKTFVSEKSTT